MVEVQRKLVRNTYKFWQKTNLQLSWTCKELQSLFGVFKNTWSIGVAHKGEANTICS